MPTTRTYDSARANAIQASAEYRGVTQTPKRQQLGGDTSDATGATNPYDRAKVYVAYGYGLTGAGVKVGVVDAGFNLVNGQPRHNEFASANKITVLQSTAPLESDSHGSHVSGLAVGDRNGTTMMGVAYNARLYLGMSPSTGEGFAGVFDEYRTNGVFVSSNSYGVPVQGDENSPWKPVKTDGYEVTARNALAYRDANGLTSAQTLANIFGGTAAGWTQGVTAMKAFQDAGGVIVFANSNYGPNAIANGRPGLDDVDLTSSLPLAFPELRGGWITVVNGTSVGLAIADNAADNPNEVSNATAKENNIYLNSAPCGLARDFCLTMDGTELYSASNKGVASYEAQTGTSQATPEVAGMIALLREAFPTASAADLAARLMFTADNRFFADNPTVSTVTTASYTNANGTITHKVSNVWGHGFPDMQGALNPVGAVSVRARSGMVTSAASLTGTLAVGGAFGSAEPIRDSNYLGNDVLNGVFALSLGRNVAVAGDSRVADGFAGTLLDQDVVEAQVGTRLAVRMAVAVVPDGSAPRARLGQVFSLTQRVGRQASIALGVGSTPDSVLGLRPRNGTLREASFSDRAMGLPFLALGSRRGQRWGAATLGFGSVTATVAAFAGGTDARLARTLSPVANRGRTGGVVVDALIGREGAPLRLNLSLGQVREQDGFLGSTATSTQFGAAADNRFARIGFSGRLWRGLGVQGNYATALTRVTPFGQGAIAGYSTIRSESMALALTADGLFGRGDRWTLGVAQPLRVAAGRATLDLPQGVQLNAPGDYSYVYYDRSVRLAPNGRELDYTLEYARRLTGATTVRVAGMVMSQPRHDADAPLGVAALVGLKTRF